MSLEDLGIAYRPKPPRNKERGIAIVGCGGIVDYGHMPAYNAAGLNVVGCFDIDRAAAEATAAKHNIGAVYGSLDDLIDDDRVEVVDIAVPAPFQRGIAEKMLSTGLHLLCQKPLSDKMDDAIAIVEAGKRYDRKVGVNQQMRYSPGMAASKALVDNGVIGRPTDIQIRVSVATPFHMWEWLLSAERYDLMYHSIHHIDSLFAIFGPADWVFSSHTRFPNQAERPETKTVTVLDYDNGLQGLVAVNHHDHSRSPFAEFRFLGTDGVISGTIGLLYDYPDGRDDEIDVQSNDPDHRLNGKYRLEGRWVPDAFLGPMARLLDAIEDDTEPAPSAEQNLPTLAAVFGAYRSADERVAVQISTA